MCIYLLKTILIETNIKIISGFFLYFFFILNLCDKQYDIIFQFQFSRKCLNLKKFYATNYLINLIIQLSL